MKKLEKVLSLLETLQKKVEEESKENGGGYAYQAGFMTSVANVLCACETYSQKEMYLKSMLRALS